MLGQNYLFKNFKLKIDKKKKQKILENFKKLIVSKNQIISSLDKDYKDSYDKNFVKKFNNIKNFRLIGMGGSILGAKAIYKFLEPSFKKFQFIENFSNKTNNKKKVNLIISKSGNTLETISNTNVLIKKTEKNIFITENKKSYLQELANKLKAEIISHNNYIGGRYSVLSEVGMLPAQLMGYKPEKFRRLNHLIKNKRFINSLINNVTNIFNLSKKKN